MGVSPSLILYQYCFSNSALAAPYVVEWAEISTVCTDPISLEWGSIRKNYKRGAKPFMDQRFTGKSRAKYHSLGANYHTRLF